MTKQENSDLYADCTSFSEVCQAFFKSDPEMRRFFGTNATPSDCPDCDGSGEVHSHNPKCPTCSGKGIAPSEKNDRQGEQQTGRFPEGKSGIYRRW